MNFSVAVVNPDCRHGRCLAIVLTKLDNSQPIVLSGKLAGDRGSIDLAAIANEKNFIVDLYPVNGVHDGFVEGALSSSL